MNRVLRSCLCFLTAFVVGLPEQAESQRAPRVVGTVHVDLERGWLRGDLCVSDLPVRGDTIDLVLNRALLIKRISGVAPAPAGIELEPGGVAVRYRFTGARGDSAAEPSADVCVEYGGAFPVYAIDSGDYRDDDSSSFVAFNGRTVRARGVSRWYPAPFDRTTGLTAETARFDLEVRCEDCGTIYVNGADPTPGPSGRFIAAEPRELLLVAGELPVSDQLGIRFIGERLDSAAAEVFVEKLGAIRDFLEEYVGVEYGPLPTVVRLDAVREPRRGQLWGFFSDPALTLIGMSVAEIAELLAGDREGPRRTLIGFLAHELSHRYFGWTIGSSSPQRDLFGEPFATFLELKAVRHFAGEAEYMSSLRAMARRVSAGDPAVPLERATADDFAGGRYRYSYTPLMLFALEAAIGEEGMRRLLAELIRAPLTERMVGDYGFLRAAALRTGVRADLWEGWERECGAASGMRDGCLWWLGEEPADD